MYPGEIKDLFQKDLEALLHEKKRVISNDIPAFSALMEKALGLTGKSIRPLILLIFARREGAQPREAHFYAACLELLHLASLIQDDVLDEALLRRGRPAVHTFMGKKNAWLAGDFLSVRVFREIEKRGNYPVLREFLSCSSNLVEGEIAQEASASLPGLEEEEYLRFIEKKTGSLFAIASAVGARLSPAPEERIARARRFGALFGTAFQIIDDVGNLVNGRESSGKNPFADIRNGIMTLPIIHFTRSGGDLGRIKSFCAEGLFEEAVSLLNGTGSIEYAMACAGRSLSGAVAEVRGCFPEEAVRRLEALGENLLSEIKEGAINGI